MKRNNRLLFTAIIGLACVGALAWWNRPKRSAASYRVGVILAESGPADFIGKPEKAVLTKLLESYETADVGAPSIELEIMNSNSQAATAAQLLERLAEDKSIFAIIGPSTSSESIPLAKLAAERGITLLSLAASKRIVLDENGRTNEWVFKFAQNDDLAARQLLNTMAHRGHRSVALLYSEDGFGKSGADVFMQEVKSAPQIKLLYETGFAADLNTADPYVSSIPANVDAVMIWGTSPGPALLLKALRQARGQLPIYLSHGNASDEIIKSAGPAAEGVVVVGSRVLLEPEYRAGIHCVSQTALFPDGIAMSEAIAFSLARRPALDNPRAISDLLKLLSDAMLVPKNDAEIAPRIADFLAAVVCQPRVLLLDEILPAWPKTLRGNKAYSLIKEILPLTAVVFVDHDRELAATVADRTVWLHCEDDKSEAHPPEVLACDDPRLRSLLDGLAVRQGGGDDSGHANTVWRLMRNDQSAASQLRLAMQCRTWPDGERQHVLNDLVRDFGFLNTDHRPSETLSGGERIALLFCLASLTEQTDVPSMLFEHLSEENRSKIRKWSKRLQTADNANA